MSWCPSLFHPIPALDPYKLCVSLSHSPGLLASPDPTACTLSWSLINWSIKEYKSFHLLCLWGFEHSWLVGWLQFPFCPLIHTGSLCSKKVWAPSGVQVRGTGNFLGGLARSCQLCWRTHKLLQGQDTGTVTGLTYFERRKMVKRRALYLSRKGASQSTRQHKLSWDTVPSSREW